MYPRTLACGAVHGRGTAAGAGQQTGWRHPLPPPCPACSPGHARTVQAARAPAPPTPPRRRTRTADRCDAEQGNMREPWMGVDAKAKKPLPHTHKHTHTHTRQHTHTATGTHCHTLPRTWPQNHAPVVSNTGREERGFLRHDGDAGSQHGQPQRPHVDAVDEHLTTLHLRHAEQCCDEAGLAAACTADDGDLLAGLDGCGDALQYQRVVAVPHVDITEL